MLPAPFLGESFYHVGRSAPAFFRGLEQVVLTHGFFRFRQQFLASHQVFFSGRQKESLSPVDGEGKHGRDFFEPGYSLTQPHGNSWLKVSKKTTEGDSSLRKEIEKE